MDLKLKKFIRDKEGYYILTKVSIQQEDITIINTYASNDRISKYMKWNLTKLKGEIDSSTIVARVFNALGL